jgi:hypothetical protein
MPVLVVTTLNDVTTLKLLMVNDENPLLCGKIFNSEFQINGSKVTNVLGEEQLAHQEVKFCGRKLGQFTLMHGKLAW